MSLKKLLWRKYLFVNRLEAETEQNYWNEKRKRHLAHEHSEGLVLGLDVTETAPPSLAVAVAAGRAIDTDGNDPEIESPQQIDCAGLVPGTGEVTVYIGLRYNSIETDPYFVDELGSYQNKFVQDTYVLEARTVPPSAPQLELARFRLSAGASAITNPADPDNPGLNEIDRRQVKHTGKEILALADLSDVDENEAAAFNAMENPGAGNPVTTESRVDALITPVRNEVIQARGVLPALDSRLDVMLNEDGSFKGITEIVPTAPLIGGGTAGIVPLDIADATPASRGVMTAADKTKLDGIEPGAAGDLTAQEILDAVKTVDGPGSGLDADTLDGLHASDLGANPGAIDHNQLANLNGAPVYYHLSTKQYGIMNTGFWKTQQLGAASPFQFAGSFRFYFIKNTTQHFGTHNITIRLEADGGEMGTLFDAGTLIADWDFDYIPNPAWIRDIYILFSGVWQIDQPDWWAFRINWIRLDATTDQLDLDLTGIGADTSRQVTARHWDLRMNYRFRGPNGYQFWATGPDYAAGDVYISYYALPQT